MPVFKTGVVPWLMHEKLRLAMVDGGIIDQAVIQGTNGKWAFAVITSARDGTHSRFSKHWTGEAIDIRVRRNEFTGGAEFPSMSPAERTRVTELLRAFLGEEFDVVLERDHIHVEYDPN